MKLSPKEVLMLVRRVIQQSEIPQAVIARDAQLSRASLNSWLAERRTPQPESLKQLAGGLRARAARLVELAEELDKAA